MVAVKSELDSFPIRNCIHVPLEEGWSSVSPLDLPLRNPGQTCCRHRNAANTDKYACIHHLFIVASPKAGTTAVHSFLLFHPQVRGALEKEGRYFDDIRRFRELASNGRFMEYAYLPLKEARKKINVDSTPTYIDHVMVCQRMAKYVPSTSRFVIVLRNPVDRLWSRQQMERRKLYHRRISAVNVLTREQFLAFAFCTQNPTCTMQNLNLQEAPQDQLGVRKKPLMMLMTFVRGRPASERAAVAACLASKEAFVACLEPGQALGDFVKDTFQPDSDGLLNYDRSLFGHWRKILDSAKIAEARRTCNQCPAPLPELHAVQTGPFHEEKCIGCHCQCYTELDALSKSDYRTQIDHCFEHLNRSRFLFVDYNEMIKNYAGTMARVVRHAGLEPYDFSGISTALAKEKFDQTYPKFKIVTGWKHDLAPAWVTNATIPDDLLRKLRAFYAPDAAYLRKLTGLKLEGWD